MACAEIFKIVVTVPNPLVSSITVIMGFSYVFSCMVM